MVNIAEPAQPAVVRAPVAPAAAREPGRRRATTCGSTTCSSRTASGRNSPRATRPHDVDRARTADGTYNDLGCPMMGSKGTGFGRNVPIDEDRRRPQAAAHARPARHQQHPDGPRHVQAGRHPQRARRRLAPVREPQLVLPRRRRGRPRSSRSRSQDGDDFPENPMRIRDTIPIARRGRRRAAGTGVRQRRDALVGRLADLRQRRREAEPAPHLRGRQDQGRRQRPAARRATSPASTSPACRRTAGSGPGCCTPCSPASTTPSATRSRRRTRSSTTSGSSSSASSSSRR